VLLQSARVRGFLWVNVSCLCWAGNIALGRWLRDAIEPSLLVTLRTVVASVLLWALALRVERGGVREPGAARIPWGLLLLMAVTGIVGYQGLLYRGLHTTSAFNAALINALCPLMTALMSWAVLGVGISLRALAGIVLSIVGVAVIVSGGDLQRLRALEFDTGDLLVLCAVVLWGAFALAGRRAMQRSPVVRTTARATLMAVPLCLAWVSAEQSWHGVAWTGELAAGIAYAAIVASVIGMLAWNRAVLLSGAAEAAAGMNMLPVYALIVSVVLLHEPVHLYHAVGGVVVVAGCLLGTLSPAPAAAKARSGDATGAGAGSAG
jgi:drug/metabolite transporter (DMT)-like permease